MGYSENDLRAMAAQARALAASLADQKTRSDFLLIAKQLDGEADTLHAGNEVNTPRQA